MVAAQLSRWWQGTVVDGVEMPIWGGTKEGWRKRKLHLHSPPASLVELSAWPARPAVARRTEQRAVRPAAAMPFGMAYWAHHETLRTAQPHRRDRHLPPLVP